MEMIAPALDADIPVVRQMLEEYAAWLAVDLCFQGFAKELATLPGDYAPPGGALFIARAAGTGQEAIGIVAFRDQHNGRAEMKRLFVRPAARGSGLGRRLVEQAMAEARARGYQALVLDTLPVMTSAQRLYEEMGFRDIAPYYTSPIAGTRFMGLEWSSLDRR